MNIQYEFLKRLCDPDLKSLGCVSDVDLRAQWPECPSRNDISTNVCSSFYFKTREPHGWVYSINPEGISWLRDQRRRSDTNEFLVSLQEELRRVAAAAEARAAVAEQEAAESRRLADAAEQEAAESRRMADTAEKNAADAKKEAYWSRVLSVISILIALFSLFLSSPRRQDKPVVQGAAYAESERK